MRKKSKNYSNDRNTLENFNVENKYAETGESEFSRESTIPLDQNEVFTERHFNNRHLNSDVLFNSSKEEHQAPNHYNREPKIDKRKDQLIQDDIREALYRNTTLDASEIEVEVGDGVVELKGFVTTREQKKAAEQAVEYITGVKDIFNDIHVRAVKEKNCNPPFGLTDNITGLN